MVLLLSKFSRLKSSKPYNMIYASEATRALRFVVECFAGKDPIYVET